MGKTEMCLKMLELLNTGRIIKSSELACLLETNQRNIVEYRKELEESGYLISSIPGKYGGYKLEKSALMPVLYLTEDEKKALNDGLNYVMVKKDFTDKDNFFKAIGKVSSCIQLPKEDNNVLISIDQYQLSMDEEKIKQRYDFINDAINEKQVIEIEYSSVKNGLKSHILHPYKLFLYNNSWFFLAWSVEAGDVRYYKLNRIAKFKKLNEKFRVWKYFKVEDYLDSNGLKNNGEWYHIEFIATGICKQLLNERVFGKNQLVEEIDGKSARVTLDMQNKDQVISFVLRFGKNLTLLSPKELMDDIKNECESIIEKYK